MHRCRVHGRAKTRSEAHLSRNLTFRAVSRSRYLRFVVPVLRSGPTTVLVLSLLFIAFVVLLHIWGKFRKG